MYPFVAIEDNSLILEWKAKRADTAINDECWTIQCNRKLYNRRDVAFSRALLNSLTPKHAYTRAQWSCSLCHNLKMSPDITLFTASLITYSKEKVSKSSAKHAGLGVGISVPYPTPVKSFVGWRPVLLQFYSHVQRSNQNTRK